ERLAHRLSGQPVREFEFRLVKPEPEHENRSGTVINGRRVVVNRTGIRPVKSRTVVNPAAVMISGAVVPSVVVILPPPCLCRTVSNPTAQTATTTIDRNDAFILVGPFSAGLRSKTNAMPTSSGVSESVWRSE